MQFFFGEDYAFLNACLLYSLCLFSVDELVLVNKNLARGRIYDRLSSLMTGDSRSNSELLVVLVTSESCKVISLCVKERLLI